ncbi:MAG: enoyl-CoA hydratase [Acidimicrobiia bacterium]|nr:enoyl-CoA hydratase [Acidimicrobiia bacterium]
MALAGSEHLRVETADGVRTITIDRPEARNAMTAAMRDELRELFAAAGADDSVAVVILTGVDPAFSAGVDLKELSTWPVNPDPDAPRPPVVDPAAVIRESTTPVIAAVNGVCVTGALEIALSCHVIVASERATFADTHAKVGLVPAWGMSALLPEAVGRGKALELSITGAFIDAPEALRIGLVNHVVPHEQLLPTAFGLAGAIRSADPVSVRTMLELSRRGAGMPRDEALRLERETMEAWRVERGV